MSATPYTSRSLAVLVPTKDRPHKIAALLDSLCAQGEPVGRVIVVDGGQSVRDVVVRYADRLTVEHHVCQPPGQIRQRNLGISLLDERTPLVACLDDDIELEPDAVSAMVQIWNRREGDTAAVSFNIVNTPPDPPTWLQRLFLVTDVTPGRVLRSGMPTSNCGVAKDVRVEWVCGGATVWRTAVLQTHSHRELPGKWAIGEDIIYSYPLSKRYPMYICAAARVRHEHQFDYVRRLQHRFHGRTQTLWVLYFVESNPDLSLAAFLWSMTGRIGGGIASGLLRARREPIEFACGQIEALAKAFAARVMGRDVAAVITAESL